MIKRFFKKNKSRTINNEAGRCGTFSQLIVGHARVFAFVFGIDSLDGQSGDTSFQVSGEIFAGRHQLNKRGAKGKRETPKDMS